MKSRWYVLLLLSSMFCLMQSVVTFAAIADSVTYDTPRTYRVVKDGTNYRESWVSWYFAPIASEDFGTGQVDHQYTSSIHVGEFQYKLVGKSTWFPFVIVSGHLGSTTRGWIVGELRPEHKTGYKVEAFRIGGSSMMNLGADISGTVYGFQVETDQPADETAPAVPVSVSATPGDGEVVVSWAPVDDADVAGYNVYVNGVKRNTNPIQATTYTVTGLTNGTRYSFTVSAVDFSGNESAQSAAVTATPTATPPPDTTPPGSPSLTGRASDGQVLLQWTSVKDAVGYIVYQSVYSGGSFGDWQQITPELITETQYTVTGLTNDQPYRFRVTAVDEAENESEPSNVVEVTPHVLTLYEEAAQNASGHAMSFLAALIAGFLRLLPVGLGLIASVMALFWFVRRGKKLASNAK